MNTKSKSSPESRRAAGKFLRARRSILNLTMAEVAFKTGTLSLSQIAIHKIETGVRGIMLADIKPLSDAYAVDAKELIGFTGHTAEAFDDFLKNAPPEPQPLRNINLDRPVTVEDLRFLITVSEGLQDPLSIEQLLELLSRRH